MSVPAEVAALRDRAIQAINELFDSEKDAADRLGIAYTTLRRALRPEKNDVRRLATWIDRLEEVGGALTELANVDANWWQTGEGSMLALDQSTHASPDRPEPGFSTGSAILTYPVAPHGHGASPTGRDNNAPAESVMIPVEVMRGWTGGTAPPRGFWTFAAGPSGEPFIPEGYPVFIEEINSGKLVEGGRYAVWLGEADDDVIKRVRLGPDGEVTLYGDNDAVKPRTFYPTDDPTIWRVDSVKGKTMRLVIRGAVLLPRDTAPAIIGQITSRFADFARSFLRA